MVFAMIINCVRLFSCTAILLSVFLYFLLFILLVICPTNIRHLSIVSNYFQIFIFSRLVLPGSHKFFQMKSYSQVRAMLRLHKPVYTRFSEALRQLFSVLLFRLFLFWFLVLWEITAASLPIKLPLIIKLTLPMNYLKPLKYQRHQYQKI